AVINLAARAGVRASLKDPWIYLDTNTKGTLNLLECCRKYGAKKFILASTSSIYGLNPYPFREDHDSNRPLTSYAASKKGAEAMAHVYNYLYGIDIVIPRYFTVYGPAGRPDMSVFKFVRRIMEGKPVTIFGDGEQKRDFTFVDDIADGTVKALRLSGYHIINLGNDDPIRVLDLVALIERFVGKKARLKFIDRHPADVPDTRADIGLSKKLLKWKPNTPVEEGVERTVAWFKDNYALIRKMQYI
ncbi:MAG: NAD-dependent epimerase/dehydratase family protein, partial [Candidatus Margulisbacteria bacterium]|nr:NAD-dependent epimerase/dehydratase family protein [Candidatus Margulisiibacteriota bacterium]